MSRRGPPLPGAHMSSLAMNQRRGTRIQLDGMMSDTASMYSMSQRSLMAGLHKNMKLENTYRMEPHEEKKFNIKRVEDSMSCILECFLKDYVYNPDTVGKIVLDLSTRIKQAIKDMNFERYRLISSVTVVENQNQGFQSGSRFLWDAKIDTHAEAHYTDGKILAVANCYAVYFE